MHILQHIAEYFNCSFLEFGFRQSKTINLIVKQRMYQLIDAMDVELLRYILAKNVRRTGKTNQIEVNKIKAIWRFVKQWKYERAHKILRMSKVEILVVCYWYIEASNYETVWAWASRHKFFTATASISTKDCRALMRMLAICKMFDQDVKKWEHLRSYFFQNSMQNALH